MLVVILTACGSIGNKPTDAAGDDVTDAPPATGLVTIEVRTEDGDGLPDLTANVLVMSDAGAVVFDGLVDGSGKASATITGSNWVTVRTVRDTGAERSVKMTTIRGVAPLDKLVFGRPQRPGPLTGAMTQRNFAFTPVTGAPSHTFFTPCGNRFLAMGTTGQLPVYEGCAPTMFDFLAVANTNPPQFVYLPGQQRTATSTITVPLPWTSMDMLTASYANVPSGMEYFATTRFVLLNGVAVTNAGGNIDNPTPGGSLSHQLPFPTGVGSGARFDIAFGNQTTGERQLLTIATAQPVGSIAFDFATQNLPRLLEIPNTTTEGAKWTETAVTNTADARLVVWAGRFTTPALTTYVNWTIIDDAHADSITLPTLPASYAAYDPRKLTGFSQFGGSYVYYADCDVVTSYAAARAVGTMMFYGMTELAPMIGASYRCRRTESPPSES